MNRRIKKKKMKLENKKLCERYPFLVPHQKWFGKSMWGKDSRYAWYHMPKYNFTELDSMPRGWRKAFGKQMCEELREELIKFDFLYQYRIAQIKEKYGELRWYDFGWPAGSKIPDIIDKYTELSHHTCMICGAPAETTCDGWWVETICDKCKEQIYDTNSDRGQN